MSNQDLIKIPLKNILNVTRVITILCYDLAPKFRTTGERHDFWEMVYVDRGELFLHAEDKRCRLKQGEAVFHRPNEFHNIECDGVHSASVFIITFECQSAAMKFFCERLGGIPSELLPLMKRLIEESTRTFHTSQYPLKLRSNAPIGGQQLIRIYLEELLIRMMRTAEDTADLGTVFTSKAHMENTLAREICAYLNEHLYDRVTLESLSETFHFGKSRLCDVFKKSMGDSIIHYYLTLKIDAAKRLLRTERLTVSEIAERLSFDSPAYFSRCFHKHTGMSPSAFRDRLINDSAIYMETERPLL
ncbi:MAG: helix-turn-helix transcriptional regulator [Clostridia bacterium]|nr:helix-turn-helix transcriptional regulator [Clostridia bacterium]